MAKGKHIGSSVKKHIRENMRDPEFRVQMMEAREKRHLAKLLREKRLVCKVTQVDLAKLARVSQAYVAKIENLEATASKLPSIDTYLRFLGLLGYEAEIKVKKIKLAA